MGFRTRSTRNPNDRAAAGGFSTAPEASPEPPEEEHGWCSLGCIRAGQGDTRCGFLTWVIEARQGAPIRLVGRCAYRATPVGWVMRDKRSPCLAGKKTLCCGKSRIDVYWMNEDCIELMTNPTG